MFKIRIIKSKENMSALLRQNSEGYQTLMDEED